MNFYDRWVLPPFLDLAMRQRQLAKHRHAAVAAASGRVLEVGVGSGLNFPLYGKQVEIVFGIDPSPCLLAIARRRAAAAGVRADLLLGSATAIPLADNTVDTVVMTGRFVQFQTRLRRYARCDGSLSRAAACLRRGDAVMHLASQRMMSGASAAGAECGKAPPIPQERGEIVP